MRAPSARAARGMFLVAVSLLALNDWVLKGSGLLPGSLTGKLSDLAGMIVAPVVLAALLGLARVPASRVVAALAVGIVFVALKTSAACAAVFDGAIDAVTRALHLPLAARTVADPTDLVALPLLALSVRLSRALAQDRALPRAGALTLGLLACAATSPSFILFSSHWGLADEHLDRIWATRVENGAVVVQLGRHSDDGAFDVAIELAAREGPLALDARDLSLELPGERTPAEVPGAESGPLVVSPPETAARRFVFRPRRADWPQHARGTLELAISEGARRRLLRVELSFAERQVSWNDRERFR